MTTLYRPVKIESAEQAEALPVGTVAHRDYFDEGFGYHHYDCARKVDGGSWIQLGILDDYGGGLVLGWTALVPIEAEEETDAGLDLTPLRRLVTPWEPA